MSSTLCFRSRVTMLTEQEVIKLKNGESHFQCTSFQHGISRIYRNVHAQELGEPQSSDGLPDRRGSWCRRLWSAHQAQGLPLVHDHQPETRIQWPTWRGTRHESLGRIRASLVHVQSQASPHAGRSGYGLGGGGP